MRNAGFEVDGLNMNHIDAEDRYAYLANYAVKENINYIFSTSDVSSVRGAAYRTETGEYKQAQSREEIEDLDTIPFPNYEELDMDKYLDEQQVPEIFSYTCS